MRKRRRISFASRSPKRWDDKLEELIFLGQEAKKKEVLR